MEEFFLHIVRRSCDEISSDALALSHVNTVVAEKLQRLGVFRALCNCLYGESFGNIADCFD